MTPDAHPADSRPLTLHVSDLDGTLLGPAQRVTERSARILNTLLAEGVRITYATARSLLSAQRVTEGVAWVDPVVVYGGAVIVDPVGGEIIEKHGLEPESLSRLVELAREHALPPIVYRLDGGADKVLFVEGDHTPGLAHYLTDRGADPRFTPVVGWAALAAARDPFYFSVIATREQVDALAAEVRAALGESVTIVVQRDTYRPQDVWLEVTAPRANKADGVASLRRLTGAARIVAFGDNINDVGMLAAADESYAMANGVTEAQTAADAVLGSNADDAVAVWLGEHARR